MGLRCDVGTGSQSGIQKSQPDKNDIAINPRMNRRLPLEVPAGSTDKMVAVPPTAPIKPRLSSFHQNDGRWIAKAISGRNIPALKYKPNSMTNNITKTPQ